MPSNNYNDPNFLRRQREKREAEKKAKLAAEQAAANRLSTLNPQTRQQAIDAHIQELLKRPSSVQPPDPASSVDAWIELTPQLWPQISDVRRQDKHVQPITHLALCRLHDCLM